jgi:hypothetical protein
MNRLRVQAENKAAVYRRALLLACNGDNDQVAYFVSEAVVAMDEERAADAASPLPHPSPATDSEKEDQHG